ncbi:MAG: glycosyltransferase family 2 protein, partial [Ramlibacter sp.]
MIAGLVSTIIPVYNRRTQLREAVESVLAQDWRPIEVIIVDDGSSDDTFEVAQALARDNPGLVHAATQANTGPGGARERGRMLARGEYIQYLDSDDVLLPGKFSAQVGALQARSDCHVAYGMTRFRHTDGTRATGPWKDSGIERATMFPSFLVDRWWDTPTPLYRREICDRAGPWSDIRQEEDWEYDCRIASLGARLAWCGQYVCEVRDHDGDRLSRGPALAPARMRQRARSHALIFSHARRAGIGSDVPEMQYFARALFLLARQCGAAGLPSESRELFELARTACGERRARGLDYRAYQAVAR